MKLSGIRVGKRHRQNVGDVRSLAASISTVGLLHPVVVDGNGRLVAGARRLAAVRLLGWRDVPTRVVHNLSDAAAALRAERDENVERKAFLPSESVSITRALEPLERADAKVRLKNGGRPKHGQKRCGKLPHHSTGKTRDKLAAVVGVSGRTLDKARAVVEAAEREPRRYGALVTEMDKTGKVSRAFAALRRLEWQAQAARTRLVALPNDIDIRHCSMQTLLGSFDGKLRAIICDPMYDRASIQIYGELARLSAKALRPGGTLAVMCGMYFLPDILGLMTPHLTFRTVVAMLTPAAGHCRLHSRKLYSRWKPIAIFTKGTPRGWIYDAITSSEDSGRVRHRYEQSEHGFVQLVEMLTEPGELVCDPFLGSGTTAVACLKTRRHFVGCDIDATAVGLTRARLSALAREPNQSRRRQRDADVAGTAVCRTLALAH